MGRARAQGKQAAVQTRRADAYAFFGVSPHASARELRRAHRNQARALHPDVNGNSVTAEKLFGQMEAVWAQISTAEKRAAYAHARGQVRVEIDEEQQTTTDPLATAAARRYEQAQTGSRPRETVSAIA